VGSSWVSGVWVFWLSLGYIVFRLAVFCCSWFSFRYWALEVGENAAADVLIFLIHVYLFISGCTDLCLWNFLLSSLSVYFFVSFRFVYVISEIGLAGITFALGGLIMMGIDTLGSTACGPNDMSFTYFT